MRHKRQLVTVLSVLSLAALACCGTNCTPPQPPTTTSEPAQPTLAQDEPAQSTITPVVTMEATDSLPTPVPQTSGPHAPLLLLITERGSTNGDLWAWDAPGKPLRQVTNYGYNYNPVISPDGKYVAYDSIPKADAPWACSGWPPSNIWVLDILSGDAVRAADQPPDSGSDACGGASFIQRPKVAWSPDSKSLAWGEHREPDTTGHVSYSLVLYNLDQRSQRAILADLPGEQGITGGQLVDWSPAGIFDPALLDNSLIVYDANGAEISHAQLDPNFIACPIGPTISAQWVMDGSNPFIYLRSCSDSSSPLLVDPLTGRQTQSSGRLEIYSLAAPGGLSLFMTEDGNGDVLWHIASPEGSTRDLDVRKEAVNGSPPAMDLVAISPDGLQVAYLSDGGLMLYDGRSSMLIDVTLKQQQEISWIGWGSTGWRIGRP